MKLDITIEQLGDYGSRYVLTRKRLDLAPLGRIMYVTSQNGEMFDIHLTPITEKPADKPHADLEDLPLGWVGEKVEVVGNDMKVKGILKGIYSSVFDESNIYTTLTLEISGQEVEFTGLSLSTTVYKVDE